MTDANPDYKVCPRCNCWIARPLEWEPIKGRAEIARLQKQCEGLAQAALNNGQDLLLHESMVRELRAAVEGDQDVWDIVDGKNTEIAKLQESVNYLQIADNHHQELMAEKEEEIARLRAALVVARKWMPVSPAYTPEGQVDIDLVDAVLAKEGK